MPRASRRWIALGGFLGLASMLVLALGGAPALAQPGGPPGPPNPPTPIRAQLTGFEEVPAILTPAHGSFEARVTKDGAAIEFKLRYTGFPSNVGAAHIHIGQPGVSGGIAVQLCGGPEPACPATSGEVTGTIIGADVLAIANQGLAAGNLGGVLRAIREGVAYVNVHSAAFAGGEIRGQLRRGGPPR